MSTRRSRASPRFDHLVKFLEKSRSPGTLDFDDEEDDVAISPPKKMLRSTAGSAGRGSLRRRKQIASPRTVLSSRVPCLTSNRVLGDPSLPAPERPHRLAMSMWYIDQAFGNDKRVNTLDQLFSYMAKTGYDGCEITAAIFQRKYFFGSPLEDVAVKVKETADKYGMRVFGVLYHSLDYHWDDEQAYIADLRRNLQADAHMGAEYVSYQIFLSDKYMGCGSEYTDDEDYLDECSRRVEILQRETFAAGMNFYVETHIERITQDPRGACKIMDRTPHFEMTGDLAHYLTLGILKGKTLERCLQRVNHLHVRMARIYGDLSVGVEDPAADWDNHGVTWQWFNYGIPCFKGGLTSRTIVEETGPIHLVDDPIGCGAKLLPYLRTMATWCDNEARGVTNPELRTPFDLRPYD